MTIVGERSGPGVLAQPRLTAPVEERADADVTLPASGPSPTPVWAHLLPWALLALAGFVVLRDVSEPLLRAPAGLVLLPGLPFLVLLRRVTWPEALSGPAAVVLAAGGTVLGTILAGLALNTVLPWFGNDRPLASDTVSLVAVAFDVVLLAWRAGRPLVSVDLPALPVLWARLSDLRWRPLPTLVLLAGLCTVAGAVRLNNGAGSTVAVLGRLAVMGLLVVALARRTDDVRRDALVVYVSSLSLLLATSLRGWYISGHDVQREFISYQVTAHADRWQMALYPSAYHACLSINILPVVWADVAGLGGTVMFKVVLQVVAALIPVAVLMIARRMVGPRLGLVSAIVFLSFPTLDNDLPFLVRQEMAFLFLALAFLVALAPGISARSRRVLSCVFGLGVVLSHYSTSYLLVTTLVVGLVTMTGLRWLQHLRARTVSEPPTAASPLLTWRQSVADHGLLHPVVLGVILGAMVIWIYPVTHSGGHLLETAGQSISNVVHGDGGPGSADESYSILPGHKPTTEAQRLDLFSQASLEIRGKHPEVPYLLPRSGVADPPRIEDIPPSLLTGFGRLLDHWTPVAALNQFSRGAIALLLQALVLLGAVVVLRRRWWGARQLSLEGTLLPVGAMGGVAIVALVPGLSSDYGVLRAFYQALVLLAPVVVIAAVTLIQAAGVGLRRVARRPVGRLVELAPGRRVVATLSVASVALYLVLTSVVSTVTGGYDGQLALVNNGPYYELHNVTDGEADGYHWVGDNAGGHIVQGEVLSDKLAAQRYAANPDEGVLVASDFYPAMLLRGTMVFLGPDTVHHGIAAEFYTGSLLSYRYPTRRIAKRLDLVFSDPDAQVYW